MLANFIKIEFVKNLTLAFRFVLCFYLARMQKIHERITLQMPVMLKFNNLFDSFFAKSHKIITADLFV